MDILFSILPQIFWFLVILIPLVAVHEFGHLLFARLFKVKVPEYGIGMPPRFLHKKWKGIVWSLNYLPLGGFVRIYGDNDAIDQASDEAILDRSKAKENYIKNRFVEILSNRELEFFLQDNNLDFDENWVEFEKFFLKTKEDDKSFTKYEPLARQLETLIEWEFEIALESKETFFSKNLIQKVLILLGGVSFNLITAFVLFFIIISTITPPSPLFIEEINEIKKENFSIISESQTISVAQVTLDSPAYKAGLRNNYEILGLGQVSADKITSRDQFKQIIQENQDKPLPITFQDPKTGQITSATITPKKEGDQYLIGLQGFGRLVSIRSNNFFTSVKFAWQQTWGGFINQFEMVGQIATSWLPNSKNPNAAQSVGGPIAVSKVGGYIFNQYGLPGVLNLIAIISIGLAVFNLLPIPALDGGRILILLLSKIFGRRNKKLEATVINLTFIALLGLAVVIAFKDLKDVSSGIYG